MAGSGEVGGGEQDGVKMSTRKLPWFLGLRLATLSSVRDVA